ncbi:MAG: tautomerase family protein [Actinobacteria bacterium]|nr:tautomerase family protein [Actinomycetota bacterium]
MPVVTVEGPPPPDLEKRRDLVKAVTEALVGAYDLPESAMGVILHENQAECVGSGGRLICDR